MSQRHKAIPATIFEEKVLLSGVIYELFPKPLLTHFNESAMRRFSQCLLMADSCRLMTNACARNHTAPLLEVFEVRSEFR